MARLNWTMGSCLLVAGLGLMAASCADDHSSELDGAEAEAADADSDAYLTDDVDSDFLDKARVEIGMPRAIVDANGKLTNTYYSEPVNKQLFSWKNVVEFNALKPSWSAVPIMYLTHVASSSSNFGMNSYRKAGGKPLLKWNASLAATAAARAQKVLNRFGCRAVHIDSKVPEIVAADLSPYDAVHGWAGEKLTISDGKCRATESSPYAVRLPATKLGRGNIVNRYTSCVHYNLIMNPTFKSVGCGSSAPCSEDARRSVQVCVFSAQ